MRYKILSHVCVCVLSFYIYIYTYIYPGKGLAGGVCCTRNGYNIVLKPISRVGDRKHAKEKHNNLSPPSLALKHDDPICVTTIFVPFQHDNGAMTQEEEKKQDEEKKDE